MSSRIAVGVVLAALAGFARTPLFAACDTTAPVLTGFNVGPSMIDTTSSSQDVTCSLTVTDDLSGVAGFSCQLAPPPPEGPKFQRPHCIATAPTSGTPRNGVWSCVMTMPRYSHAGVWTVSQVVALDAVGNKIVYTSSQLVGLGYPSSLTVTSDPDTLPPVQTAVSLSPGTLDVSSGPQNLTCNMTVTDDKAGVLGSACAVFSPSRSHQLFCAAYTPSSGTILNGVFSCSVTVPQNAEAGTWTAQGAAEDFAFNGAALAGPPITSVAVTSVNPDTDPPTLTSFDFNPISVSDGTGPQQVVCTMVAADSIAGVDTAECSVTSPVNDASVSCTATAPISGTRNNGTFQCSLTVPQYAAAGEGAWEATLTDLAGNSTGYLQDPVLTVACAAGDAETTCRFAADRQSLTWDAMAGATRYNVYRGPLTNLVDANADHIPDGGYGTCQNSRTGTSPTRRSSTPTSRRLRRRDSSIWSTTSRGASSWGSARIVSARPEPSRRPVLDPAAASRCLAYPPSRPILSVGVAAAVTRRTLLGRTRRVFILSPLLYVFPAVVSVAGILIAWSSGLLRRPVIAFAWTVMAMLLQCSGPLFSLPWVSGLIFQVALAFYLIVRILRTNERDRAGGGSDD